MHAPKECDILECKLHRQLELRELKTRHQNEHASLVDLIEAQAKIINNLTNQMQVTTTQVVSLTSTLKKQFERNDQNRA